MKVIKNVSLPLVILGAFFGCAVVGMLIEPQAFFKFFSPVQLIRVPPPQLPDKSYYWDVEHYASLALNLRCNAFYPLWPAVLRFLFNPQSLEGAAFYASVVGTGLFFVSTPFLFWLFEKALNRRYLAFLLLLAFTLNPMAIFRVNGYTESLFTVLSAVFIWVCLSDNLKLKLGGLFGITFLMALTRPVLVQMLFASGAALLMFWFFGKLKLDKVYETIAIWLGSFLGYSVYGSFCLNTRGDFLAPFQDQKLWGKSLGLHLELLLTPKSLLFDLLGLYFPVMVLVLGLVFVYFQGKDKRPVVFIPQFWGWNVLLVYPPAFVVGYLVNFLRLKFQKVSELKPLRLSGFTDSLRENYLFLFSVYFCVVHCGIVFFTQDRLFSLGRFVFGVPFFFLALGYLYRCIPGSKKYAGLLWMILVSAVALILQWVTYGQDGWLG
ncbi:hypothetical protein NG798_02015 [Ancylothrix sp. C2]|uniref:hypothetical protein n=1 Tax=Ancylothrix sp. D3o TaxID=2953691 RepID=UPI0021BAF85C|nr:hypothetical protein [Ancylothrix sp. D3o]MCT7948557.1 hypothetical protein [Ancylothrix sp. D3o]